MSEKSNISWTDATWSPVTGCDPISPGCKHCYAKREVEQRWSKNPKSVFFGRAFNDVQCHELVLSQPLSWKKPRKIFVCPRADLFHDDVPDCFIDRVFAVMALASQHTFQVLTKRPERMRKYLTSADLAQRIINEAFRMDCEGGAWMNADHNIGGYKIMPLPNVWLGVSVEDQAAANERIPLLLDTPAAVRWISAEPLLGPVSFRWASWHDYSNREPGFIHNHLDGIRRIDWVVVGGESGQNARPMHPDWARSLRDQCAEAGVPFYFKQWSEWHTAAINISTGESVFRQFDSYQKWVSKGPTWVNGGICLDRNGRQLKIGADMMRARDEQAFPVTIMHRVGVKNAGRLLDGLLHDAYPEVR